MRGGAIREVDGTAGPEACGQEAARREREQRRQDWRAGFSNKGHKGHKEELRYVRRYARNTKTGGKANRLPAIGTVDSTAGFEALPRPP